MCLKEFVNNIPIIRNLVSGTNYSTWLNNLTRNEQNQVLNTNAIFLSGRPENNLDNERNSALFQFSNHNQNARLPFPSSFNDSYLPHQNNNSRHPNQFNPTKNRRNDFHSPNKNRYSSYDNFNNHNGNNTNYYITNDRHHSS